MKFVLHLLLAVGGGIFVLADEGDAQSTLTPVEYTALVAAVENTTPTAANLAPPFGNFYTVTHGESWPPLPSDTLGLNFWSLGGNYYLLDDRDFSYNASWADFEPPPFPTNGASGGGGGGNPYFTPPVYTTNDLWLEITAFTNRTASLVIHTPWNDTNLFHDLYYTGNPDVPWQFLMRCPYTNVVTPVLCAPEGFFRLGPPTNGNLTVNSNVAAFDLAQMLVPPGVTLTNVVYTGSGFACGSFAGGNGCGLPLDTGVILSTGQVSNAIGPNNDSGAIASANGYGPSVLGQPGDADLDKLVGNVADTYDAAVLEFDLISTSDISLGFQYIFASEEYPEWIGPYNDPMAIFVSTNRVGGVWTNNITNDLALVPGTDLPVSVNSINGGWVTNEIIGFNGHDATNSQYYVDNHDPDYSSLPPYALAAPAFNIQYDGMTVLLTAQTQVSAHVTNHVKIAIADYGDGLYDSAVFIKAWMPCN